MISETTYAEAYVWIWLPDSDAPIVAGRLSKNRGSLVFNYGRSYLARNDAIPIYAPELPLQPGELAPLPGLAMPSCIRDASPDAWGRRVLINRKFGTKNIGARNDSAGIELDELTYLLESGSDRIGALDFQLSPTDYVARQGSNAALSELLTAAENVERGVPLSAELALALQHGTSLGGARPKAQLFEDNRKYIAKFSASNDLYNVVKAEYIAMRLAERVGLDVATVRLTSAMGKDVLLVERFDRTPQGNQRQSSLWRRRAMVSALTMLELDEMMAGHASYEKLAEIIRHRFANPRQTLQELFGRIVFNILCGNTDDHARNHAAFWDGRQLTLTPAYDICPQSRTGQVASQGMLIRDGDRSSQLATCIAAAPAFLLNRDEAIGIANHQVAVIEREWEATCHEAALSLVDRNTLWRRQFLNPYAFYDAPDGIRVLPN